MTTNLRWGIFAGCINEGKLIQAKLDWALRLGMKISIVEGYHPNYKGEVKDGHSADETTEILRSYSDRIVYNCLGQVSHQAVLRDYAYKSLPIDLDVVIMSDIDEFYLEKDLKRIEEMYASDPNLKLTLTNSYIFLDGEHCAPHVQHKEGGPVAFNKKWTFNFGQWHERIFRYNKFYTYSRSPYLINDIYGRFVFSDSAYFGEREIIPNVYMLHYKNFKMSEQKARHEMYKQRGDKVNYDEEWEILESTKFKYEGEHPKEIKRLLE